MAVQAVNDPRSKSTGAPGTGPEAVATCAVSFQLPVPGRVSARGNRRRESRPSPVDIVRRCDAVRWPSRRERGNDHDNAGGGVDRRAAFASIGKRRRRSRSRADRVHSTGGRVRAGSRFRATVSGCHRMKMSPGEGRAMTPALQRLLAPDRPAPVIANEMSSPRKQSPVRYTTTFAVVAPRLLMSTSTRIEVPRAIRLGLHEFQRGPGQRHRCAHLVRPDRLPHRCVTVERLTRDEPVRVGEPGRPEEPDAGNGHERRARVLGRDGRVGSTRTGASRSTRSWGSNSAEASEPMRPAAPSRA